MRAALLMLLLMSGVASATAARDSFLVHVDSDDIHSLRDTLLTVAEEQLRPAGLVIDRQRAWLDVAGALLPTQALEVRPLWSPGTTVPPLPLKFELRPVAAVEHVENPEPVQARLAVVLLRPVWVAARRLSKGSLLKCDDLVSELRDVRRVSVEALASPCAFAPATAMLHDVAAGNVVRTRDVGIAPDVAIGAPVRVSVSDHGITVTTTAISLADARIGDQLDVRLQRPNRTLRTRVTGPGAVELLDERL